MTLKPYRQDQDGCAFVTPGNIPIGVTGTAGWTAFPVGTRSLFIQLGRLSIISCSRKHKLATPRIHFD